MMSLTKIDASTKGVKRNASGNAVETNKMLEANKMLQTNKMLQLKLDFANLKIKHLQERLRFIGNAAMFEDVNDCPLVGSDGDVNNSPILDSDGKADDADNCEVEDGDISDKNLDHNNKAEEKVVNSKEAGNSCEVEEKAINSKESGDSCEVQCNPHSKNVFDNSEGWYVAKATYSRRGDVSMLEALDLHTTYMPEIEEGTCAKCDYLNARIAEFDRFDSKVAHIDRFPVTSFTVSMKISPTEMDTNRVATDDIPDELDFVDTLRLCSLCKNLNCDFLQNLKKKDGHFNRLRMNYDALETIYEDKCSKLGESIKKNEDIQKELGKARMAYMDVNSKYHITLNKLTSCQEKIRKIKGTEAGFEEYKIQQNKQMESLKGKLRKKETQIMGIEAELSLMSRTIKDLKQKNAKLKKFLRLQEKEKAAENLEQKEEEFPNQPGPSQNTSNNEEVIPDNGDNTDNMEPVSQNSTEASTENVESTHDPGTSVSDDGHRNKKPKLESMIPYVVLRNTPLSEIRKIQNASNLKNLLAERKRPFPVMPKP